jgi:HPt (histidine-containing phosphotransfer) domain-containing protein
MKSVVTLSHRLNGGAGILGADRLAQLLARIEQEAGRGMLADPGTIVSEIEAELSAVLWALGRERGI